MSFYKNQLENYLKTLDIKAGRVLDVGGSANPIDKRVKSWDVKEYRILDNHREESYHEKWRKPDESLISIELNTPKDYLGKYRGWADTTFCLEVFEYLVDPYNSLLNICNMTKEEGFIYITTAFSYPCHNPVAYDSSRFTRDGFKNLMARLGLDGIVLDILECIPRRYSLEAYELVQRAWKIDGLRAAKNYDHNVVGHIWKLQRRKA